MMKLLLLQPPIEDFYDTDIRLQPIGLAYLKACVDQHLPHIETKIIDFHRGWGRRTIAIPKELKYLKPYYAWADRSPFCGFHEYFRFGADLEEMVSVVLSERPTVIGISSLFSPYYREVLCLAQALKQVLDVPIILGGSHVSAMPEMMLSHAAVDFVIRAEGERPLVAWLSEYEGSRNWQVVPNLGYKDPHGAMIWTALSDNYPIEELPVPDVSDLPLKNYTFEGRPMCFLVTSRSCPHRCSFCSVHQTFGTTYRIRSVENVLAEIKVRYNQGFRVFDFEDDNLTFYKQEFKLLCRRIATELPVAELEFLAMNGISYLSLDDEMLDLMRTINFTHLNLALVSSDTTVRETTKRPHTLEKFHQVVPKAVSLGFKVVSYQILGLPSESVPSMIQTLITMAQLPVLQGASMFYLTPNSPIAASFPAATERDVFLSRLTAMAIETPFCNRDQLFTLFITTRILNFIKSWELPDDDGDWQDVFREKLTLAEETLLSFEGKSTDGVHGTGNEMSKRFISGMQILQKLFAEKILFADTPTGLKPLFNFQAELFFSIWRQLPFIQTLKSQKIWLCGKALLFSKTNTASSQSQITLKMYTSADLVLRGLIIADQFKVVID